MYMIQRIVNALKLDRPIRYYSLLYLLVILLTYSSSYFYYQSKSYSEWTSSASYLKLLDSFAESCMSTQKNKDFCLSQLSLIAKKKIDRYGHQVFFDDEEIIDNRRYKDRKLISNEILLKSLNTKITVIKTSIPKSIWTSVFHSATFSIFDIINRINKGQTSSSIWKFVKDTAWYRSVPHLSFLILVFFTSGFMKRSIIAQITLVDELERLEYEELDKDI